MKGTGVASSTSVGLRCAPPAFRLELLLSLPPGYHRLRVAGLPGKTLVVAAPPRCYRPIRLM